MKPIVKEPNEVLRARAAAIPLSDITSVRVRSLISEMSEALAAASDGVGLAAPQVGESLRLFLVSEEAFAIDRGEAHDETGKKKQWAHHVFINPVMKKFSRRKADMAEGCLSVPGRYGVVARNEKVFLEWFDERGEKHRRGFSKFAARVMQHELDHLEGVLILDRAKKMFKSGGGA